MFKLPTFSLPNFEGPLELLLYLVQKQEVDVCDVSLKALTHQFFEFLNRTQEIAVSAELLELASSLLLIKSRRLLPQESALQDVQEEDLRIEILNHVLEYCHFRQTAELLAEREEKQKAFFPRQVPFLRKELTSGLEEVGLDDLKKLLLEALTKSEKPLNFIQSEKWEVGPKIEGLQKELAKRGRVSFFEIFSQDKCRGELIVYFLALLELIKEQILKIEKDHDSIYIICYEQRT